MKKDGEEVLQGTSLSMGKLHQKIIGVDIESISYNKIIILLLLLLSRRVPGGGWAILSLLLSFLSLLLLLLPLLLLLQLLIKILILLLLLCYCYCYHCCFYLRCTQSSSRCTGTWESFAASITEWLFEGTLHSDSSDATEEVAFPEDSVYQSSSTHQVLRKTQCHTNTSQEACYWGLRLPEPITSPPNQPY